MANALVVRRDQLPRSQIALRAAQYVRMSNPHQITKMSELSADVLSFDMPEWRT